MVAGLATITPASGFVGPLGGLIIGVAAGGGCFAATQFMKRVLKIDDSLDVFAVHGVGGATGILLTAIFVDATWGGSGLPEGVSVAKQFGVQMTGIVAVLVWSAVVSFIIIKVVQACVGLRVKQDDEVQGLDFTAHGESGYNF